MNLRLLVLAAGVIMALAGLWSVFKPHAHSEPQVTAAGQERVFSLDADVQALAGPKVLSVRAGDTVSIVVRAGADDELHVHGYNFELDLHANQPETLRFTADKSGRFEMELHRSHVLLAVLEVAPQ